MKSSRCTVMVWLKKKGVKKLQCHVVALDNQQQMAVLDLIQMMHGGIVKALPKVFESIELVEGEKK